MSTQYVEMSSERQTCFVAAVDVLGRFLKMSGWGRSRFRGCDKPVWIALCSRPGNDILESGPSLKQGVDESGNISPHSDRYLTLRMKTILGNMPRSLYLLVVMDEQSPIVSDVELTDSLRLAPAFHGE